MNSPRLALTNLTEKMNSPISGDKVNQLWLMTNKPAL